MMCKPMMKLLLGCRVRTCLNLFISLVTMCLLIYYMLGKILDNEHLHPRKLQKDIFIDGEPSSLMAELGFMGEPKYYPQAFQDENDLPIFILPLHSSHMKRFFGFLFNFRKFHPNKILVVYDLGLGDHLGMVSV